MTEGVEFIFYGGISKAALDSYPLCGLCFLISIKTTNENHHYH